jgi:hypothetical protein
MIFPKINTYPIILPLRLYKDKFNNINSYIEMNPSIYIDELGNVKILVRTVNYKKYDNYNWIVFENISNSKYVYLSGKIEEGKVLNIENFSIQDIIYSYNTPVYFTHWKGLEDIRFIDAYNLLITIPECNQHQNPSIFLAKLNNNEIYNFVDCKPNIKEKNWMPFIKKDGKQLVIYSLDPFRMKEIIDEIFININFSDEKKLLLKNYHGSSNGLNLEDDNILFLIHINKEKPYHRWLIYNEKTNDIKLSNEFTFFCNSYIEFCTSIAKFKDRLFISLGVNDDKAYIIETNIDSVKKSI